MHERGCSKVGAVMTAQIAETAVVYPGVQLGANVIIEDYCVIGIPPANWKGDPLETVIGDNSIIRSHTVLYAGNTIGNHFQTGNKANIRELNVIGSNVSVGTMSVVEHHVEISDGVRIHSGAFIPEFTVLKANVWIGPNVVFTNAKYPASPGAKEALTGVQVDEGAIIGANTTLLPGVRLGATCLVGAGSVVTCDVEPGCVVVGSPAVKVNDIQNLPYSTV